MSTKILIIEDEKQLARLMELELYHEGYDVEVVHSGSDGLEKIKESNFQLILLDLMLPGINGYELCSRVREFSDVPIIMVTARDAVSDKVKGLDTGADDYITKPFSTDELMARIRAQLRRNGQVEEDILAIADLEVDTNKYRVKRAGELVDLTKKEYDLLVYLLTNEGIVLSREDILNSIWGYDYYGETNIVDVYIRYLRSKIDDPFDRKLIHTVRGVGYVLRDED